MKYLILLASGLADAPIQELGGRTPLEAAHTPALDALAREGKVGRVRTIPDDLPASEEVALLSLLGYDPTRYFTGEAGLAAAGLDVPDGGRVAYRYNLATVADGKIEDIFAGQIAPREAEALLVSLSGALGRADVEFLVGRGFCGVLLAPEQEGELPDCAPPESALGKPIEASLPSGKGADLVRKIALVSREVFQEHDVNRVRADLGENPANILWPWGPGRHPVLPPFRCQWRLDAAMVAGHESARGLGRLTEMGAPAVAGATGSYKTDYAAKAQIALDLLKSMDLVVIHAAQPADAALDGNVARKIRCIEDIDALIVAPILEHARRAGDVRILVAATHTAETKSRRRTRADVPIAMFGPGLVAVRASVMAESSLDAAEVFVAKGWELLPYFLRP